MPEIGCKVCTRGDNEAVLILCDGCDEGFHTYCIGIGRVPRVERWYCAECIKGQSAKQKLLQRRAMRRAK